MVTLPIDIHFELICPWCLIGKRHLDSALQQLAREYPELVVEKRWRSVQLLPDMPQQGLPFMDFYRHRLGDDAAVRARQAQVRQAAAQAGVSIAFERIEVMPNTARAHRLLDSARRQLAPAQLELLIEQLFLAYFQHGVNIGDPDTLLTIGREHGIDEPSLVDAVADSSPIPPAAGAYSSHGVPFFVFDNNIAMAGAVAPDLLLAAMRDAIFAVIERPKQEA